MRSIGWFLCCAFVALAQPKLAFSQTQLPDGSTSASPESPIVIYQAKDIVTLDPDKPNVDVVAVKGDKIFATGSLRQVKKIIGKQSFVIDDTFKEKVFVPGFVAQHDHPFLAGITMTSAIISIEDWVLPEKTYKAAKGQAEYTSRLREEESKLKDPNELLLSWGYHHYMHGELSSSKLDAISSVRPIIVWHRSAHEMYFNSVAQQKYGISRQWHNTLNEAVKKQTDFDSGHYWEQGFLAIVPLVMPLLTEPKRLQAALEFFENYLHVAGITLGAEPGGLLSRALQDAQNSVLSDADTPFRFYFIADGKSLVALYDDESVISKTESLLGWGNGMTDFLPKQVKLFADGAVFSQAMQLREDYSDGHGGEWMMDLDVFARAFQMYWDSDYQIHVHVNGDKGLDMVLDQLENNLKRNPRIDHRTVLIHFAVSQPDQIDRIKKLGAIVSANPYYPVALADNYRSNGLEPARADNMVRLGDIERAGISYSLHSDMPMAPAQPLFLMWSAVNRITNDGNLRGAEQRVSRLGALRAVTLDAAYSLRLEKQVGSIEPEKLANFTVLGENPVTIDPLEIKDIKVWATIHEGRIFPIKNISEVTSKNLLLPLAAGH
jgi:predicted amidohydrolase YtcJ